MNVKYFRAELLASVLKQLLLSTLLVLPIRLLADPGPSHSEQLMHGALAAHFARIYCKCRYPQLEEEIEAAYGASRLRLVQVPCSGFSCSVVDYSNGMDTLLKKARQTSDDENLKACVEFSSSLQKIEAENDAELRALEKDATIPN